MNTTKIFSLVKHLDVFLINRGLDTAVLLKSHALVIIYSFINLNQFNKKEENMKNERAAELRKTFANAFRKNGN